MLRDTAEMEERITQATHYLKAEVKADAEEQAEAKVVAETWTVAETVAEPDDDYVIQSNREQAHTHIHTHAQRRRGGGGNKKRTQLKR